MVLKIQGFKRRTQGEKSRDGYESSVEFGTYEGGEVAVKSRRYKRLVYNLYGKDNNSLTRLEANIMLTLKHNEHILQCLGVGQCEQDVTVDYRLSIVEQINITYGIYELMTGNMSELANQQLSSLDKHNIAQQIYSGLQFLHTYNILHLNLKQSNILWTRNVVGYSNSDGGEQQPKYEYKIKLSDFGVPRLVTDERYEIGIYPPEIRCLKPYELHAYSQWSKSVDIWSYGLILYRLMTFNLNYDDDDNEITQHMLLMDTFHFTYFDTFMSIFRNPILPINLSLVNDQYRNIITRCLLPYRGNVIPN